MTEFDRIIQSISFDPSQPEHRGLIRATGELNAISHWYQHNRFRPWNWVTRLWLQIAHKFFSKLSVVVHRVHGSEHQLERESGCQLIMLITIYGSTT